MVMSIRGARNLPHAPFNNRQLQHACWDVRLIANVLILTVLNITRPPAINVMTNWQTGLNR